MTTMNRAMVFAGIATVFQAGGQILLATLALLQYFCVIDFLGRLPTTLYIKILYFHNPNTCGMRVSIGSAIEGMATAAQVLLTQEPLPTRRTFYLNTVSLGLAVLWLFTCCGIMRGGAIKKESKPIRWPWLTVTALICGVDLTATVIFIQDSFHTRTLSDLVEYAGGVLSGAGNVEVDTSWASWVMVIIYSRFVGFFLLNLLLIICVVIHVGHSRRLEDTGVQVEPASNEVQTAMKETSAFADDEMSEDSGSLPVTIPRPGLSQVFRRMKEGLFRQQPSPRNIVHIETGPDSINTFAERLENPIAEQRQQLEKAVVDTTGRGTPSQASQSLPHLAVIQETSRGRRGTLAELQGQLPWTYMPGLAYPFRDQLPPEEDLPPVPLADYTAIPSFRKTSVHRAASSLSSLVQKRDEAQEGRTQM